MEILELFGLSALLVWSFMSLFYLISIWAKDASIIDIAWGLGFILVSSFMLNFSDEPSQIQMIIHILITLWGSRLAVHVFMRNLGKGEDWRYANWRAEWRSSFIWRSYLQIFMLQGLLMTLMSAVILVAAHNPGDESLGLIAYFGVALWVVGFFFESVGDFQLRKFLKNRKTKGKIMRTGVWKYTRHPNYFGEVSMWWGLFLIVVGMTGWPVALISPLIITYLLLKVSGIPMLEKKYSKNKQFQNYKKYTSAFFPMLPK